MFYTIIQRGAETLHSLFYRLLFFFPPHLFDWLRGKCQMKTCALSGKQKDEICDRNKESMSRSMWLILAHSAGNQMGQTQKIQHEGSRALPFFFFWSKPTEAAETLLPKGSGSKAGYVPGMSTLCLCLLWIWASISLFWNFSWHVPVNVWIVISGQFWWSDKFLMFPAELCGFLNDKNDLKTVFTAVWTMW